MLMHPNFYSLYLQLQNFIFLKNRPLDLNYGFDFSENFMLLRFINCTTKRKVDTGLIELLDSMSQWWWQRGRVIAYTHVGPRFDSWGRLKFFL